MSKGSQIYLNPEAYFTEVVQDAVRECELETIPLAENYLVSLLKSYLNVENLFSFCEKKGKRQQVTLAELYLRAAVSEKRVKVELLRKLGDTSLYVSGFFGDSLRRKIVDIDYYVDMGGAAYERLAYESKEDVISRVYSELSGKFKSFVNVLSYISQKTLIQSSADVLRLYDRYLETGSSTAKAQLIERGLLSLADKAPEEQ